MNKQILFALTFVMLTIASFGQEINYDVILKVSGEEMEGKVTEMNEADVAFVYKNETITYRIKKSDILKITFSSGRVEFFNKQDASSGISLADHHNKVAILPFAFIKDQMEGSDAMSEKIQLEAYQIFNEHRGELNYQDPLTTNAMLVRAGVNNNNIRGYTMGEICDILGVEYVIQGVVDVEKTTQSNYTNITVSSKSIDKTKKEDHKDFLGSLIGINKRQTNASSVSTTVQNYQTAMTINVFNDKGHNIFNKNHTSFWNTQDAYRVTLKYLAKRTPLYKK